MSYQALLFCADEKTARVVAKILSDLDFGIESCTEPFTAVKRLTKDHFDAVVVDCHDEQNATLLFKSARNSESNRDSLAVALVEGQAGIAKAFRIGANLVLTKPINVEQSKSTLRTARGLLRKTEASKAAAASAAAASAAASLPATSVGEVEEATPETAVASSAPKPIIPLPPKPVLPAVHAAPVTFEVEEEPVPPLGPAEAALLESMPDPILTQPTSSLRPSWQPVAAPRAEAAAAKQKDAVIEPSVSGTKHDKSDSASPAIGGEVVEAKGDRTSAHSVTSNQLPGSQGAATAAAPAREIPREVLDLFESKSSPASPASASSSSAPVGAVDATPVIKKSGQGKPLAAPKKVAAPSSGKVAETGVFSWSDAVRDQEASDEGDSKKNFVIAAVLVVGLAVGGYFGWPWLQPTIMSLPLVQKYVVRSEPTSSAQAAAAPATPVNVPSSTSSQPAPATSAADTAAASPEAGSIAGAKLSPAGATPAAPDSSVSSVSGSSAGGASSAGAAITTAANGAKAILQPVVVPPSVEEGLLQKKVAPAYPTLAQQKRVQGTVQLLANISKEGNVTQVKVLSGDAMLTRSAMEAVRQWKYNPYVVNGQPVDVQTGITVDFKLP